MDFDLRRELLLFDQLALPFLEETIEVWSDSEASSELNQRAAELEWLADKGIVVAPAVNQPKTGPLVNDYKDYISMQAEIHEQIHKMGQFAEYDGNISKVDGILKRAKAYAAKTGDTDIINRTMQMSDQSDEHLSRVIAADLCQRTGTLAIPVLPTRIENPLSTGVSRVDALNIAIHSIPFPAKDVPLERLLDFRNDPDVKADFLALHKWATSTVTVRKNPTEILEEVEYLVSQYERHMKIHRIELGTGALETLVTIGAEALEDVVKLKWGSAAKLLFSLRKRNVGLLKAELSAPGKELAYLVKASSQLG